MTKFRPFRGILFDDPTSSPGETGSGETGSDGGVLDISAVIDKASRSEFAVSHLRDHPDRATEWLRAGWMRQDEEPALYMFRVGSYNAEGIAGQASGVFGVSDGPDIQTAAGLIMEPTPIKVDSADFDLLLIPFGMPVVVATMDDGTHYRLWRIHQFGVIATIAEALESAPISASGLMVASTSDLILPPGLVFFRPEPH